MSFRLEAAERYLAERLGEPPEILLVLGSGLGGVVEAIQEPVSIPFREVPGFPATGVAGHAGRLVAGFLEGRRVLVKAGRFHFYEGHPSDLVVAPVRLGARLGARVMVVTNAAGGIAPYLEPGSLLLLDDHLNLFWRNPLVGPTERGEVRFPDLGALYDRELQALALEAARELRIPLEPGVYAGVLGPSYETPTEVRVLQGAGAHAVGMSTVPEVLAARAAGLRVLALSLITNRASGLGGSALSHDEVLEMGARGGAKMESLLRAFLRRLPRPLPGAGEGQGDGPGSPGR